MQNAIVNRLYATACASERCLKVLDVLNIQQIIGNLQHSYLYTHEFIFVNRNGFEIRSIASS